LLSETDLCRALTAIVPKLHFFLQRADQDDPLLLVPKIPLSLCNNIGQLSDLSKQLLL